MGDDFDNLINTEEEDDVKSYSSLDSVISVINEDGEEELIDLYQFYRAKSTRKKSIQKYNTQLDIEEKDIQIRKRKESLPQVKSSPSLDGKDVEESGEKDTDGEINCTRGYRDHHILTALDIQAKARERYDSNIKVKTKSKIESSSIFYLIL